MQPCLPTFSLKADSAGAVAHCLIKGQRRLLNYAEFSHSDTVIEGRMFSAMWQGRVWRRAAMSRPGSFWGVNGGMWAFCFFFLMGLLLLWIPTRARGRATFQLLRLHHSQSELWMSDSTNAVTVGSFAKAVEKWKRHTGSPVSTSASLLLVGDDKDGKASQQRLARHPASRYGQLNEVDGGLLPPNMFSAPEAIPLFPLPLQLSSRAKILNIQFKKKKTEKKTFKSYTALAFIS